MSALISRSDAGRFVPRNRAGRDVFRTVSRLWGRWRPRLLFILPIALVMVAIAYLIFAIRLQAANATIRKLTANQDIPVATSAAPEVLLARVVFLLGHERIDEVQPYVEALDKKGPDKLRAIAHYNFANGRLRQAFDLLTQDKIDPAGPFVVLARQEYRRGLTFEPDDWDAKFNLDVASRLIRDFPSFERTTGDATKTDRKKIWTDIPGKPEGLP